MSDRDGSGRFLTGANGGPGRPKGSRNRLSEAFIAALCEDFDEHGAATIVRMREADPVAYVKVVAAILPRHVKVDDRADLDALTDEEIAAHIRVLERQIADVEGPGWLLRLRHDRGEDDR